MGYQNARPFQSPVSDLPQDQSNPASARRIHQFSQVERTLELLVFKYLKAYISYRGIQRLEKFLFPHPSVREALLNAMVHKDYGSGIPIQVRVYDDKIVLWNPGQLPRD